MRQRTPLPHQAALLLASCLLTGCAGASQAVRRSNAEVDVGELVFRRVLSRPEMNPSNMVGNLSVCLMRGHSYEASPVTRRLLQRFEPDARSFTTGSSVPDCARSARRSPDEDVRIYPIFLETVRWEGGDTAEAEASFACGQHGCARGAFALERGPAGWRVVSERFCDEDPYSAPAAKLDLCPEQ